MHTLDLVTHLSKKGYDFHLLSSDAVLLKEFKKRAFAHTKMWAPLEPVSLRGIIHFLFLWPLFFVSLFFHILKVRKGPTTLFCLSYTEKILFTPWARLLGMKVVWMEHLRIERSYKMNPFRLLYVLFSRFATVVTVSHGVGEQLEELGIPQKNIEVVYNGIDLKKFTPQPRQDGALIIGAMSRLVHEKGVDILIKAFAQSGIDAELHIAGAGEKKEALRLLAKKMRIEEKVVFVGFVNPVDFLRSIDIFALTSRSKESFGYVAAEAMAVHLPVVASNISGLNEVVLDGETGYLCEIEDVGCISERLKNLAHDNNLRQKMGKRGRERVEKFFAIEKMIDAYAHILKKN